MALRPDKSYVDGKSLVTIHTIRQSSVSTIRKKVAKIRDSSGCCRKNPTGMLSLSHIAVTWLGDVLTQGHKMRTLSG